MAQQRSSVIISAALLVLAAGTWASAEVLCKNKKTGASLTYMLVSEEEADLKAGKISTQSPIGKGLLGKKKGDVALIKTPAGEMEFEVMNIGM